MEANRYDYNETMKLIGHSEYGLEELGEQHGYEGLMDIVKAYGAETRSGKLITNVDTNFLLCDTFILGVIYGIRRERRRRHNAG